MNSTDKLTCCYKAADINTNKRDVRDAEIKHGIAQLRYAMPGLMRDEILNNLTGHIEDNQPFIICPILLTTADLYVVNRNSKIADVEAADELHELAKVVPYLILYSGYGPEFGRHTERACKVLLEFVNHKAVEAIDEIRGRIDYGEYTTNGPIAFMNSLARADDLPLGLYFTQFIVCTFNEFCKLADRIKRISAQMLDKPTNMGFVSNDEAAGDGQNLLTPM